VSSCDFMASDVRGGDRSDLAERAQSVVSTHGVREEVDHGAHARNAHEIRVYDDRQRSRTEDVGSEELQPRAARREEMRQHG